MTGLFYRWRKRREQRECMHHDIGGNPANSRPAISWIAQHLIESGKCKMLWCTRCDKTWFS